MSVPCRRRGPTQHGSPTHPYIEDAICPESGFTLPCVPHPFPEIAERDALRARVAELESAVTSLHLERERLRRAIENIVMFTSHSSRTSNDIRGEVDRMARAALAEGGR